MRWVVTLGVLLIVCGPGVGEPLTVSQTFRGYAQMDVTLGELVPREPEPMAIRSKTAFKTFAERIPTRAEARVSWRSARPPAPRGALRATS